MGHPVGDEVAALGLTAKDAARYDEWAEIPKVIARNGDRIGGRQLGPGVDLNYQTLARRVFVDIDFSGADFHHTNISQCWFVRCRFTDAFFDRVEVVFPAVFVECKMNLLAGTRTNSMWWSQTGDPDVLCSRCDMRGMILPAIGPGIPAGPGNVEWLWQVWLPIKLEECGLSRPQGNEMLKRGWDVAGSKVG